MTIDYKKASDLAIGNLESWLPGGTWKHNEYIVKNPKRNDTKPGSFKINKNGVWQDFATDDKGKDGVSLYAYIFDLGQGAAAKEIFEKFDGASYTPKPPPPKQTDIKIIMPVPKNAPRPRLTHPDYGNPAVSWEYRNQKNELLFMVARFNTSDGKVVIPFVYTQGTGWRMKAPPAPRPLYNLNHLKPSGPVLIVEGEKCADAGQLFLCDTYSVLTWQGGGKAVHLADWKPLFGRDVILWPDADNPGIETMKQISEILSGKANSIRMLPVLEGKTNGWDIFDAICENFPVLNYIEIKKEKPPYRALGLIEKTYYFLSDAGIISFGSGEMRKTSYFMLAPLNYWEMEFPGKNGPQWDLVTNTLIRQCHAIGRFSPEMIRGRGAWYDEGRFVIHNGDHLIVNGLKMDVDDIKSKFVYEKRKEINEKQSRPLIKEESSKLLQIFQLLNWEKAENAYLAAGWCAIAPICGALEWRPHVWLTGPAGSGKSWVLQKIIKPLLGEGTLFTLGKSSEAGIRQSLGSDAIPVVVDEAEAEEKSQAAQLQMILTLMRQSSSEGDAIVKGTPSGKSICFRINSCFMLSSIGVSVRYYADDSRITVLSLKTDESRTHFQDIEELVKKTLTPEYCSRIRARIINMAPVIRNSAKVFSGVTASKLSSQRLGDQIGILFAGAYALLYDDVVSEEFAGKWIEMLDTTDEEAKKELNDEIMCLQTILQSIVKTDDNKEVTIGEAIATAAGKNDRASGIFKTEADNILRRHGIRYIDGTVFFASSHSAIKKMLQNTSWESNYTRTLRRIEGAGRGRQVRFTDGIVQRTTKIPVNVLLKKEPESEF